LITHFLDYWIKNALAENGEVKKYNMIYILLSLLILTIKYIDQLFFLIRYANKQETLKEWRQIKGGKIVKEGRVYVRNFRHTNELCDYYHKHMSFRRVRTLSTSFIRDLPLPNCDLEVDELSTTCLLRPPGLLSIAYQAGCNPSIYRSHL